MRWSERQLAMLREMGVPSFWPVAPQAEPLPGVAAAAVSDPESRGQAPTQALSQTLTQAPIPARPEVSPEALHEAPPRAAARANAPAAPTPAAPTSATPVAPLGPRPAGVDTMGWLELEQAVSGCQACGLCQGRRHAVFGVGNPKARWMIVGEAPGEQEDREGEPFVGRAGQLLDRMLAALDLSRGEAPEGRQVYITNVLKCRPPANRNPQPQEVAQCEPYLMRQVALVQPDLILAMGRFAVQSLLKTSEPIGKLRGRVHEVAGVPVVVTYHPAYLLRNPVDKALAWDDLCLARELQARLQSGGASGLQSLGGSPR